MLVTDHSLQTYLETKKTKNRLRDVWKEHRPTPPDQLHSQISQILLFYSLFPFLSIAASERPEKKPSASIQPAKHPGFADRRTIKANICPTAGLPGN
jgi:hypothetical protein